MIGRPRSRMRRAVLAGVAVAAVLAGAAFLAGPLLRDPASDPAALQGRLPEALSLPAGPTDRLPGAVGPPDPGGAISGALDALADATRPRATPRPAPGPRPARPPALGPAALVVSLTNTERERAGCPALTTDPRLDTAAERHSEDMAAQGYFSHDSQDGRSFDQRISSAGYPDPGAENIARGQPDAASVMKDWMNSPDHRRNILDCSLRTIGVGQSDNGDYWTQDFGR